MKKTFILLVIFGSLAGCASKSQCTFVMPEPVPPIVAVVYKDKTPDERIVGQKQPTQSGEVSFDLEERTSCSDYTVTSGGKTVGILKQ